MLKKWFDGFHKIHPIDLILYEEVMRHQGTKAAHIYGAIEGAIQMVCYLNKIPFKKIPVGTIKKHATGKGKADKQMMVDAAEARGWKVKGSDDKADALWMLDYYLFTNCQNSESAPTIEMLNKFKTEKENKCQK